MSYLFTSESVSEGHPDKIADQVSDAILDAYLAIDPNSKVACETLVTTNRIIISGEITSKAELDLIKIARDVIVNIGYTKNEYLFCAQECEITTYIDKQSPDINQGVEVGKGLHKEQGAGDQGIMFGYATDESENYMPLSLSLSHMILEELSDIRKNESSLIGYLRPDSKSQVTIEYTEKNIPAKIDSIVISTQHDDFADEDTMLQKIREDMINIVIPRVKNRVSEKTKKLFSDEIKIHINPTGKFVIGGPHGDTGLTGRKIIVDTYGGKGGHGGGAFSGKDPSKVDRSAAYATRHVAKNLVAAGIANEILVQIAYAIGVAEPISIYVNTYGTSNINLSDSEISQKINKLFNLKPSAIIERFNLKDPIYTPTASYGHMGRKTKKGIYKLDDNTEKEIELFPWEKLDYIEKIKTEFNL
ncbi:MAG: methionine adenosyltransferase [Flavobacteriales bacterium]|nr:methionine adenosyltransferase [Flavobacteriales bacterium]|tara:strand:- start:2065 stop:3315 length:1251 start_codon:yes stop_codon:yes gene_type:complete